MKQITPPQLAEWLQDESRRAPFLLDVREPNEFAYCAIPGSVPMPMASVPARMQELPDDTDIVVICHHGGRSMQVAIFLERQGFTGLINLAGGVAQWAQQVDPGMPQY
jgi:rhodanese-related sulfurtransferase